MSAGEEPRVVMARHARSFAPAARLLGRKGHDRIARLYALCRTLDDLADENGGVQSAARLNRIAEELRAGMPRDPVVIEAHALFDAGGAGREALARLVGGVRSDLTPVAIPDLKALDAYADAVAGTVGIMVCDLFDIPRAYHTQAAALGRAMQITNICRDVREDAMRGRRYLPATLCPHSAEDIAAPRQAVADDVRRAVERLLIHAETLYAQGSEGYRGLPFRLRIAVSVAAELYRGIGGNLREGRADPVIERSVVSTVRKFGLASEGIRAALAARSFRTRGMRHA